jgi:hypothetical protein
MVAINTIEDALYDWVHLVLPAVPVIWYHQNAPRPIVPYLSLHLSVINSIGVDAVLAPDPIHTLGTVIGNRDFVLLCQGIGLLSMDFLETLKLSLEKPSIQAFLQSRGLVFVERLANTCIAEVVDNRYEERNILDLKFRFAQYDSDQSGLIAHANLEKDFFAPDLNTITVEHSTIP